jgi:hypothetical protein
MADDAQSIRSLNWRELFPFINLFRAFRIAIHPSKIVLGFALLVLVYSGGRILDAVWPRHFYAAANEIDLYTGHVWSHEQAKSFVDILAESREQRASEYGSRLETLKAEGYLKVDDKDPDWALNAARLGEYNSDLRAAIVRDRNDAFAKADSLLAERLKALGDAKDLSGDKLAKVHQAQHRYKEEHDATYRQLQASTLIEIEKLNALTPRPLFDAFFEYESRQFDNVVKSALHGNWLDGIASGGGDLSPEIAGSHQIFTGDVNVGVLRGISNLALIGPGWLLAYHTVYFILFAAWFLLVWAIFGGAIARIAGVHVARDEKISVREALRFSTSKLLSFIFAPLIPLIIILGAGVIIAVGGLLMYIPVIGPITVGVVFFLALLAGLIITLVATGTVGGFNLMYPTIAVEGSDSFDAISRSFSYVFARPWRMVFYTAVSLVYAAFCFIFVRFFVYVVLATTHFFVQLFLVGQPGRYWNEIWPSVSDQDLAYRINFQALAVPEKLTAVLIAMWVYIALTFLAAFVVSFYFSSNTIIYYLMRREVDATELDDVYVEEAEEDFPEPAATPATPADAVAPTTAAPDAPTPS